MPLLWLATGGNLDDACAYGLKIVVGDEMSNRFSEREGNTRLILTLSFLKYFPDMLLVSPDTGKDRTQPG
jgi:hypothetical protein